MGQTNQVTLSKIKFIMLLGKSLHRYGASSDRIEKAMTILSHKLSLRADFFSIPTSINASFKIDQLQEETRMDRLAPGKVNLAKLVAVDQTVDLVVENKLTIEEGTERIEKILQQNPMFGNIPVTISYGLISFAIAIFLKGNWMDAIISLMLGLIVGLFSETVREERLDSITEGVSAFFITIMAMFITSKLVGLNTNIIILSSIVTLLPGLMLTTSIHELAGQNLTSGTARLTGSMIILLKISFGVYMGTILAHHFGLVTTATSVTKIDWWINIPVLLVAALGLSITFQASYKDFGWIILASSFSFLCSSFFKINAGEVAGPFLASAAIAAASNIFSRIKNRPSMIFLMPAIILMVPGSIGFKGVSLLFQNDLIAGINSISRMAIIGIALVSGTYFGSVIIKPRRTL